MSLNTHDSDSLPYTGSPPSSNEDPTSQPPSLHSTAVHLVPAMTAPQTRKSSVAPSTRTFSSETTTATIPLVVGSGGYSLDHYPTWTRKYSRTSFFSDETIASTSDIFSQEDTENEYDTSTPNWPYTTNPPSIPDEVLFRRGFWDCSLNDKDDWNWGWDTGARFSRSEGDGEGNEERWERVSESGVGFEMEWDDDESMGFFQSNESLGQQSYVKSDAGMTESEMLEEVLHVIVENSEEGNTRSPSQHHGGSHGGSTDAISVRAGPSPLTATSTRSLLAADAMDSASSVGIHSKRNPYTITTTRNTHNPRHHKRAPHRENTYSSQQSRQSLYSNAYSPTQHEPIQRSYGQSIIPSRNDSAGSQKHLSRPRQDSDARKHSSSTQRTSSTQQTSSTQHSRSTSSTHLAPAPIRQESWDPRKASSSTQQSSGQQSSGQQSSTQQSSSNQQSSTLPSNQTATTSSMQLYQTNATSLDLPKDENYGGHTDAESNVKNEDAHDDEEIRPDSDGYYMLHDEIPFVIEFDEPEAWLGPNAPRNELSGTSQQIRTKSKKVLPRQLKKILTLPGEAHSSADKVGGLGGHKKKKRVGKEREGRRDGRRVSTRREVMQIVGDEDLKDKGKGRIGWKWGWGM